MSSNQMTEECARELLEKEVETIHADHLEARDRIHLKFPGHDGAGSNAYFNQLRVVDIEKTRRITHALIRTRIEAHERTGESVDLEALQEIEEMVARQCRAGFKESTDATASLMSDLGSLSMFSAFLTAIERDFATLRRELHRELCRKAVEQQLGPETGTSSDGNPLGAGPLRARGSWTIHVAFSHDARPSALVTKMSNGESLGSARISGPSQVQLLRLLDEHRGEWITWARLEKLWTEATEWRRILRPGTLRDYVVRIRRRLDERDLGGLLECSREGVCWMSAFRESA